MLQAYWTTFTSYVDSRVQPRRIQALSIASSGCQAGLAFAQEHRPEFAHAIWRVRHTCSCVDLGTLVYDGYRLSQVLYKRLVVRANKQIPMSAMVDDRIIANVDVPLNTVLAQARENNITDTYGRPLTLETLGLQAKEQIKRELGVDVECILLERESVLARIERARERDRLIYRYTLLFKNFSTPVGVFAVFLGAVLTGAMLNRYLQPAVDLQAILETTVPATDNMYVNWITPKSTQWLMISKILTSLALALFSSERKAPALTAFLQGAALWKISQQPWIWMYRIYSGIGEPSTCSVTLSCEVLLPRFSARDGGCASLQSHYTAQMKALYDYTTTFFNGSTWDSYWFVKRIPFQRPREYLSYNVTVTPGTLTACGCKIAAMLSNVRIFAWDKRSHRPVLMHLFSK